MATHDYIISNASGAAVRSDLNAALAAIVSNNSSATEPATPYAYMWWADTTTGQLKLRNAANDDWVVLLELDGTNLMEDGSAAAPGLAFAADVNTGIYRPATDSLGIATGGANAVYVNAAQNVGIGNVSPGTKLDVTGTVTATAFSGPLTGAVTGNASTATTLQTARTIGGVSFNGSANINLPGVNTAGNQNTSGNAASATVLQTARTIGGVSFDGSANINLPGVNTAGNQNTSGNAATATILQTTRTINGVNFNGSANITVEPYIEDDEGTNATRYIVFTDSSTAGFKRLNEDSSLSYNPSTNVLSAGTFSGNGGSLTSLNASNLSTGTVASARLSGSYGISVTGSSASCTGNSSTATTLQTTRTINGTNFNGSANITTSYWGTARTLWGNSVNGSANITGALRPADGSAGAPAFSFASDTNTGIYRATADAISFSAGGGETVRITTSSLDTYNTHGYFRKTGNVTAFFDRSSSTGNLCNFRYNGTTQGNISIASNGTTIEYNTFCGSHWAALADWSRPDIKIGTIMETIDELVDWKFAVIDVDGEQKKICYNGTEAPGEVVVVEYEGEEYDGIVEREEDDTTPVKSVKVRVCSTAASKAVLGVFTGWNTDGEDYDGGIWNDMGVASVGNFFVRMAAGQTPTMGDLVESNGSGCGVVQDDDVIRTKTVGKITSTIPQETYDDGSFLVTCVLYCG